MKICTTTIIALAFLAVITASCSGTAKESKGSAQTSDGHNGTFTDSRDGKKYRTVKIGNLIWMAENLNFETGYSSCNKDEDSKCAKYGRFYEWRDVKKACPAGWRVPSVEDWDVLAAAVGGRREKDYFGNGNYSWKGTAIKLKSKTGWRNNRNGTDDFGFSALPCERTGWSYGYRGFWWTSTEQGTNNAKYQEIEGDEFKRGTVTKSVEKSLRCVKGNI